MKRSRPANLDVALGAPARRKRALSEEEQALWEAVAESTRPLKRKPRPVKAASANSPTAAEDVVLKQPPSTVSRIAIVAARPARPEPPPLTVLGRRERSALSRGKKEIEARIDLHGMTQARAHRALLGFLLGASDDGLTFVLVITGKGRGTGADSERGVLRRQVPEWLGLPEFRSCVVGFEEAHISHGGSGALYIRIRRMRRSR